jgi:fatty-acyl-CoA synthase
MADRSTEPPEIAGATQLNYALAHEAIGAAVPDQPCILWRDRRFTWADVTDRTRRLAAVLGPGRLADDGAIDPWESPHRHVALYLTNGNEYLEGMVGAWKAGWASVNVNYRYVADELVHVLTDSDAAAIVYHGRFAATLAEVLPRLPRRPRLLQVDDGTGHPLLPGAEEYEAALAGATPRAPQGCSPDDRYVVYTGGTTGYPKGVLWRQADFIATCLGVTEPIEVLVARASNPDRQPLRALPAPPFMHGAAHWNALSAWLAGGAVVIQDDPTRLDPADLLDTCARHDVSSLLIVGDAFARPLADELRAHPRPLPSLRHLVTGGAILSAAVRGELLAHLPGLRIVDILGSSETGRHGVRTATGDAPARSATFGRSATTLVLSDDRTHALAPGDPELGWLAQRGRVPLGYLHDRDRTEATFPMVDGERMAVAGDRARLTEDGSIELHGRDSGTINSGGEKIFAEEVELALKHHPSVYDVLVVGRPSERWGQELVAVVALRPDLAATDAELRDTCEPHLARYKWPKAFVRVPQVERSPSGKPDYAWARREVAAALDGS